MLELYIGSKKKGYNNRRAELDGVNVYSVQFSICGIIRYTLKSVHFPLWLWGGGGVGRVHAIMYGM